MSGPGPYQNQQAQQMYHQSMPRTMSGGQMNAAMMNNPHSGMMMTSQQQHMINAQNAAMVSQQNYNPNMMGAGQVQAPAQNQAQQQQQQQMMMNSSQPQVQVSVQMSQPIINTSSSHLNAPSQVIAQPHMSMASSQNQPQMMSNQPQLTNQQQTYMQHQQQSLVSQQPIFGMGGAQPRSPAIGQLSQAMTPGGPPSVGGPPSNNPQTPLMNPSSVNPSSQQAIPTPATPQQAPSSVHSTSTVQDGVISATSSNIPPDPTTIARNLIMKDLRHAIFDLSRSAAEIVRPSASRQQLDASVASHNPLSVNPQSVNPLSVNPSSVKSVDEPKSVDSSERKAVLTPRESYNAAMNNFLAVCDQIEINLLLISEAQKQCARFDKMFTGELKSVGDMANANYSQYAVGYLESTNRVRNAINRTLHSVNTQIQKVRTAQALNAASNSRSAVDDEKMETEGVDSEAIGQQSLGSSIY